VGALKVACVGLQCVGFNNVLYRTICAQSGKWKTSVDASSGSGIGNEVTWNASPVEGTGGDGRLADKNDGICKSTSTKLDGDENDTLNHKAGL
jgi:hypothetical protein